MKKYPFVKQAGTKECGAATLLMLIKYYNGYISMKDLVEMTKTNKNGTTMYHLVNTLNEIGFEAAGVSCDFDTLKRHKNFLPFICHVTIDSSYKHFIIVYKINSNNLIVGDPSIGIRKITFDKFRQIYNNSIIIATLKSTIPYMNDKNYNLNKIIKRNKKIILVVISYSFLITLFSIISSFYFGKLINYVDSSKFMLLCIFIIYSTFCFVKFILEYIKNKLFIFLNKRIDIELTKDIFYKLLSLPYKHYKNHTSGDIISRINDLYSLKDFITSFMVSIFIDVPIIIVSIFILLKLNIKLFLISLFILFLNITIVLIFKKITYFKTLKMKNLKSLDTSYMLNAIDGFETIKGLNIKSTINDKVMNNHIKYLNYEQTFATIIILKNFIGSLINDLGLIIIDYVGILLVYDTKITLSTLITFNTVLSYFSLSVKSIVNMIFNINDAKSSFKRINDIMIENKDNGFLSDFEMGDISINNLSYSFDDFNNSLNNICLNIKNKEKLLVIGKSGSGKSTLFKILKGYYKVGYDKITINNIDINNYKESVLSNHIIYINQSEILFNDTLINNINIKSQSLKKVIDICNICHIKEIIKNNNLGFNMIIEDNGFNLSGGERQRIVLARSLLSNFDILILDEALNQIDILLERKILNKMFEYFKDKTIINISHRLNNIELYDHIIEMKEGKIINNEIKGNI